MLLNINKVLIPLEDKKKQLIINVIWYTFKVTHFIDRIKIKNQKW